MQNDISGPVTDTACMAVMEELKQHEPIFHRPEFGTSRSDFEAIITENFWEIGASGNIYSRSYILDVLEQRHSNADYKDEWETDDFHCSMVAENHYLVSYLLKRNGRLTRRATLWSRTSDGWRAFFHQGTHINQEEKS
jgi:hypothetical protein